MTALIQSIQNIAHQIDGLQKTVVKSRNRHREVNRDLTNLALQLLQAAKQIETMQGVGDTNMMLFEALADMYARGHVLINPNSPIDIQNLAKDLFGSMQNLLANYSQARGMDVPQN